MELLLAAKANVHHADKLGTTSLIAASGGGYRALVETLLAAKANVDQTDKNGATALMYASVQGHIAPVETLLAAKAPIGQTSNDGWTFLMYASGEGHSELAELLESWPQLTPLMMAVVLQSPQEVKALLHAGADPACTVQLPSSI